MATTTTTSARQAAGDSGLDMTRNASEIWAQALETGMATMTTMLEVGGQMQRQFLDQALSSSRQGLELWADLVQGSAQTGSARMKDAVESMAETMKETTARIGSVASDAADDGRATTRSSRAS